MDLSPYDSTSALERVDATRATVTLGPRVSLLGGTVVVVPAALYRRAMDWVVWTTTPTRRDGR